MFVIFWCTGPLHDGSFKPVSVTSIRRHKIPCQALKASQSASVGLDIEVDGLRRGMVLLSPMYTPTVCYYFQVSDIYDNSGYVNLTEGQVFKCMIIIFDCRPE